MKRLINEELNRKKKELYLHASARYFDVTGFKNFKISDLAKELETSVGTIYNLFGSKEELYVEYLILKLETFLSNLLEAEVTDPLKNLKTYLKYKYADYIEQKERDSGNDPYFFHKLEVSNHRVVEEIYEYLARQFRLLLPEQTLSYKHFAILFKKLSDGFIESLFSKTHSSEAVVDETITMFFEGVGLKVNTHDED